MTKNLIDHAMGAPLNTYGMAIGTPILTLHGKRRVEDLLAGDQILTKDFGMQQLKHITFQDFDLGFTPENAPIIIPAHFTKQGRSDPPIYVAPDQPILLRHYMFDLFFGQRDVLITAKDICNVKQIGGLRGITYASLEFQRPQLVFCDTLLISTNAAQQQILSAQQARLACSVLQNHIMPTTQSGFPLH